MNEFISVNTATIQPVINMVLDTVSERSKRDYSRALTDFITWHQQSQQAGINRAIVFAHVAFLEANGTPASSINQRLSAIRKLALESADSGLISETDAQSVNRIKSIKIQGHKLGNWLTKDQASQMIRSPDVKTLKGKRNRAILSVMIGCGLRREELTTLKAGHLQQREGRWVILDLQGKHNRTRTVPMAAWVKTSVDSWLEAASIDEGYLFRPVRRGGHLQAGKVSSQAVWNIVEEYAPIPGLAPHDLRRTFAKLAYKAGSPIERIRQSLGHASIQETEVYLDIELDLQNSPSDMIQLDF